MIQSLPCRAHLSSLEVSVQVHPQTHLIIAFQFISRYTVYQLPSASLYSPDLRNSLHCESHSANGLHGPLEVQLITIFSHTSSLSAVLYAASSGALLLIDIKMTIQTDVMSLINPLFIRSNYSVQLHLHCSQRSYCSL